MKLNYLIKPLRGILLIGVTLSLIVTLSAQFGGGEGTEADPWQIGRPDHLDALRNYLGEEHNDKYYIQTANIDLTEATREGGAYWNEGDGWEPIGHDMTDNSFQGNFDGNNYTISGLYINRTTRYASLFGVTNSAVIKNVHLVDVDIQGGSSTGSLNGLTHEGTVIENCTSSGIVRGTGTVGGLVSHLQVGSIVRDSYSSCDVIGTNDLIGGLIGSLAGQAVLHSSYATGDVQGRNQVGGLAGRMWHSTIRNCYSRGEVNGDDMVGGLIGQARGNSHIEHSYGTGRVAGGGTTGGLLSNNHNDAPVINCYWDTQTTEQETSPGGGDGRLTRQMVYDYDAETYVDWDFDEIWADDANQEVNDGYPVLHFQDVEPPVHLDPPVVSIEFVDVEGQKHSRLSWAAVDEAQSYKVYASDDLEAEDWGEAIAHTGETVFVHPVGEEIRAFYYVIALVQEAP